jgi:hypothetical protein
LGFSVFFFLFSFYLLEHAGDWKRRQSFHSSTHRAHTGHPVSSERLNLRDPRARSKRRDGLLRRLFAVVSILVSGIRTWLTQTARGR